MKTIKSNTMLTEQELQQIAQKGISEEQLQAQLKSFEKGFPFLRLQAAESRALTKLKPPRRPFLQRPPETNLNSSALFYRLSLFGILRGKQSEYKHGISHIVYGRLVHRDGKMDVGMLI